MYQSFYTAALGAGTCMAKMGVISNNMANVNNNGFKPKNTAFTDLLQLNLNDSEDAVTDLQTGNGVRMQRTYSTFNTDAMEQTNSVLDYAIIGDNQFFMVQDPVTDAITYTRSGHFHRAEMEDGVFYLMTDGGKLVLDQNGERIEADVPDVERLYRLAKGETVEEEAEEALDEDAPRVSVYTFTNPSRLLSVGDNEWAAPEDMEPQLVEDSNLVTCALERSGTDLAKEMTKMIECQHAYSYALKMVITADEVESTINSLRG